MIENNPSNILDEEPDDDAIARAFNDVMIKTAEADHNPVQEIKELEARMKDLKLEDFMAEMGSGFVHKSFLAILTILPVQEFGDIIDFYMIKGPYSEIKEINEYILFVRKLKDLVKRKPEYTELVRLTLKKIRQISFTSFTVGLFPKIEDIN